MALKPASDPATFIVDATKVVSIYGVSTFHDAEILELELNREGPLLLVRLWTFKLDRQQVDGSGYFKRTDHCQITFRFASINDLSIQGFNHQNVLSGIIFELIDDGIRVNMEGTFGAQITFRCSKLTVEHVQVLICPPSFCIR